MEAEAIPVDPRFPNWGDSRYHSLRRRGSVRLADLLAHLYVLLPVLDDEKHYWVGDDDEHNVRFESLPAGQLRHRDHRFEWSRSEFSDWATRVAAESGYEVQFAPIGVDDPEVGAPTQMAVFSR